MPENLRVFIVEDDTNLVQIMRLAMEREGWELNASQKYIGAEAAIAKYNPDIILLDINLPDGNGFEVCKQVAGNQELSKIPVIFLTAKGDVESRLRGFACGGRDYVSKPFSIEELTARIRAHVDIKRRQDNLQKKVDELTLVERVHQDLVDMIIHDLRAPLGTIEVTLEMVRDSGLITDQDYARIVANAKTAAEFALCMVSDILDIGAGKLKVNPGPLDVAGLTQRLKALFTPQFERQRVIFKMEIETFDVKIETDTTLLFRVLMNLLSNALKFSRPNDEVQFSIKCTPQGLRAIITDRGPGIADAEKEKIFEKYYRAKTPGLGIIPGSGLGLAFCRLAASSLRGKIRVEDNPGGGSKFILEIPSFG